VLVTLEDAVAWLENKGTSKKVAELERYGITANEPFGVAVGDIKKYAKHIGVSHHIADQLWATGRYEARLLAAYVDDPDKVTVRQMNQWAKEFDNWAIVDTVCFHLFDRTQHAWTQVPKWARAKPEFKKRAAFALLWSLSTHDKAARDDDFLDGLALMPKAANDERNFVKKAVNMALRAIGKRNAALNQAAIQTAEELSTSDVASPRWAGKNALRELESANVKARLKSG